MNHKVFDPNPDLSRAIWAAAFATEFSRRCDMFNGDVVHEHTAAVAAIAHADRATAALELARTLKLEPRAVDDDTMIWSDFLASCHANAFIDDDGFGELATATHVSDARIYPSWAVRADYKLPAWATHVNWYNK